MYLVFRKHDLTFIFCAPKHRDHHHYPIRFPLGGGLVAGLPHSWGYHPSFCYPILVSAPLSTRARAPGPREVHTRADEFHQRLSPSKAQVLSR